MNSLDIVLIIILCAAGINGFIKGFFVELASIVSLILGIWLAVEFSELVLGWISKFLDWNADMLRILAFVLIFIFVVIVVHLVATATEKFVRAIALSIFSRIGGAIIAALKAAFILSIFMMLTQKIEKHTRTLIPPKLKSESTLYTPIENIAPGVMPFLKAEHINIFEFQVKPSTKSET